MISTALLILSVSLVGTSYPERLFSGHNDFLQLYSGAVLVRTPALYSFSDTRALQTERTGLYLEGVYYSRLPFYAALLSPLGKLRYPQAYALFQLISVLCYALFVLVFLADSPRYAIWAPVFLPLIITYLAGQDVTLVLLFAALFVKFALAQRDIAAGAFLSLCLIKFHFFLFVPLALLAHGRRRLFQSAALGVIAWMVLSFGSNGLDWPKRYAIALSNPEIHPGADHMPTLLGFLNSIGAGVPWLAVAFIGGAFLFWRAIRLAPDLPSSLGLALLAGLLLAPHAYIQDCALLLLILPLLSHSCSSLIGRALTLLLMTPIPYLLTLRGVPTNAFLPLCLLLLAHAVYRNTVKPQWVS